MFTNRWMHAWNVLHIHSGVLLPIKKNEIESKGGDHCNKQNKQDWEGQILQVFYPLQKPRQERMRKTPWHRETDWRVGGGGKAGVPCFPLYIESRSKSIHAFNVSFKGRFIQSPDYDEEWSNEPGWMVVYVVVDLESFGHTLKGVRGEVHSRSVFNSFEASPHWFPQCLPPFTSIPAMEQFFSYPHQHFCFFFLLSVLLIGWDTISKQFTLHLHAKFT